MEERADTTDQCYGIGAVAKLTGLTDHTIRVWERRYAAVVADRAPNGRRVYTAADIEKLRLLKTLTDQGLSISAIAGRTTDALREQIKGIGDIEASPLPDRVRVAVLGDVVSQLFPVNSAPGAGIEILVSDSDDDRFEADITRQDIDVIVMQSAFLDADTTQRVQDYLNVCGARRAVLIYGFGRSSEINLARTANTVVLRSPVDANEIMDAIKRTYLQQSMPPPTEATSSASSADTDWTFTAAPAPRRFTQQQIANLANISSTIECECPQHLAQLVAQLSAFEIYSAQCANRDDEDAALHRYLHQTTAEARAMIERALDRVVVAEGLSY